MISSKIDILKSISVILFVIVLFTSCKKDPDHSLYILNQHSEIITNVWLGKIWFENIPPGGFTTTKKIDEGDYILQISMSYQPKISQSISIKGDDTHKWKITVTSATTYTLSEYK